MYLWIGVFQFIDSPAHSLDWRFYDEFSFMVTNVSLRKASIWQGRSRESPSKFSKITLFEDDTFDPSFATWIPNIRWEDGGVLDVGFLGMNV